MAPLSAVPQPTIAFVGFMGAGKTRAAKGAAAVLGEAVSDVDSEIERERGVAIAELFAREGEDKFRAIEERATLAALERGGLVALGGGAVESATVREALAGCFTVWCRASVDVAWQRSSKDQERPLARDRAGFERRFAARQPLYEEVADAILTHGGEQVGRLAARWLRAAAGLDGARLVWGASRSGEYPAIIARGAIGLLASLPAEVARATGGPAAPERWFAVADAEALRHHRALLPPVAATIEIDGGEQHKTLAQAERVLRELAQAGARRDDGILALGGGVTGDLAGFCAATYQRGVPVVHAPTTLVAQVDSAYGGKTGVDLPEAKNYAGAYHMPYAVLADPATLTTLPAEELRAGFAEVLKTALVAGGRLWDRVRALEQLDPEELDDVIFACARTKLDVVAADERDADRRQVLNLGHTVGHAIEAASGYGRYRHGEAIALGLLAALRLSGADELRDEVAALLGRHGLPTTLDPAIDTDDVLAAGERDKKADAEGVPFVLLERPGAPVTGARLDAGIVRAAVEELR